MATHGGWLATPLGSVPEMLTKILANSTQANLIEYSLIERTLL